jgi:hypothetical protein
MCRICYDRAEENAQNICAAGCLEVCPSCRTVNVVDRTEALDRTAFRCYACHRGVHFTEYHLGAYTDGTPAGDRKPHCDYCFKPCFGTSDTWQISSRSEYSCEVCEMQCCDCGVFCYLKGKWWDRWACWNCRNRLGSTSSSAFRSTTEERAAAKLATIVADQGRDKLIRSLGLGIEAGSVACAQAYLELCNTEKLWPRWSVSLRKMELLDIAICPWLQRVIPVIRQAKERPGTLAYLALKTWQQRI